MLTKDPAKVERLNEHLWRKIEDHRDEIELVKTGRQEDARTLLVSYGITARAMLEAALAARRDGKKVSTLTILSLWPVPEAAVLAALLDESGEMTVERVVVAEMNHGQYRQEIERVVYTWATRHRRIAPEITGIHRVDGELIAPEQFMTEICL